MLYHILFNVKSFSLTGYFLILFMMNLIKYPLLFLIISFNYSYSQINSTSATASVNMIMPLSITAINSTINFGEIVLSGNSFVKYLTPAEGAIFNIIGHPERSVTVSYNFSDLSNSQWVAQNGGTVGKLSFFPKVVHTGSNSSYQNPVTVQNGNSYILITSGSVGVLYIWVGGSINILANQPAGDYIGTFNITVSY